MTFVILILATVGILLVYSAIRNENPRDVIQRAFRRREGEGG